MKCNFEKESIKWDSQTAVGEPEAFSSLCTVDVPRTTTKLGRAPVFPSCVTQGKGLYYSTSVLSSDKWGPSTGPGSQLVLNTGHFPSWAVRAETPRRTSWNCPGLQDIKSKDQPTLSLQRTQIWKAARDCCEAPIHSGDIHYLLPLMTSPWGFLQTQSLQPVGTHC